MSIDFYKEHGPLGYLANYSNHGFTKDGVYYKTAEHYYQASKFDDEEIRKKIICSKTPKEASNIGRDRNNIRKKNCRNKKLDDMYEAVYLKFSQNKDIRSKLIETRNEEIREMTTKESYWGIGPDLDGLNNIGKILMRVRKKIKNDLIKEIINNCKNKKIYIIGHHKPDADSVISAYLLTNILKSMKIDAVFSLRDKDIIDKELIKSYLNEEYEIVNDYNDKQFVLVDHNNLDGIPKENVIASFDHHRITGEVDDLIEIEYASTALLIYDLFKSKYNFSNKEKELIALSVLSDTEYLTSQRFTKEDRKLYDELNVNLNVEELKNKFFKTTNFNNSINVNLHEDYKEYDYNNQKINRSLIKSYSSDKDKHYDEYTNSMKSNIINLLIWCDYEKLVTYLNYNGVNLTYPTFTTSTYLILDYLEKQKYLKK